MADQIKNDAWQVTGDPTKTDLGNRAPDSQNRLSAIVKVGKAVDVILATSAPDEVFTVFETGK